MLQLENVSKVYTKGKNKYNALNNINLSLDNIGFVSILGPSGCGKTTLLNIIGGLDTCTQGEYKVDNININKFNSKQLDSFRNSKIGFIFQNYNLINHLTVYDNVALALKLNKTKKKVQKQKILDVLNKVGLSGKEYKKPQMLSGGEAQRVAIARAIINDPQIILADEATGSLDSKTSVEILNLLKEISKTKLVILVTHNEKLALEYSDRILNMHDGNIVNDTVITEKEKLENKEIKKVHLPFYVSLLISYKNIITKLFRVISTIFSGSVGIIAVILIITLSNGVSKYINNLQVSMLKDNPITITKYQESSTTNNITGLEEYPDTNEIYVIKSSTTIENGSYMDEDLVDLINNLDKDKYELIDYGRRISLNIYSMGSLSKRVSTSYLYEANEDVIIESEFDCISGRYPKEYNEIALLVDSRNAINSNILNSLGLDNSKDSYSFDEIINKEYIILNNDDIYTYNSEKDIYERKTSINGYDCEKIKIVGILRTSKDNIYNLFSSGILYTKDLTDYMLNINRNSQIGLSQLNSQTDKNVLTGKPFEDRTSGTYVYSKEYLYEEALYDLGLKAQITSIKIYTNTFEDRNYIESNVKESSIFKNISNIYYRDYMSTISKEFSAFIKILTNVLIILACVSLLVSSIMISIITYISVLERQKEIGILRSIGARKIDIISIFCSENAIIGIMSGIVGTVLATLIKSPINEFVQSLIKENVSNASSVLKVDLIQFDYKIIIALVCGNVLITIISGLLPAILASVKSPVKALKSE